MVGGKTNDESLLSNTQAEDKKPRFDRKGNRITT